MKKESGFNNNDISEIGNNIISAAYEKNKIYFDVLSEQARDGIITVEEAAKNIMNYKQTQLKKYFDIDTTKIKHFKDGRAYLHIGVALAREHNLATDTITGKDVNTVIRIRIRSSELILSNSRKDSSLWNPKVIIQEMRLSRLLLL